MLKLTVPVVDYEAPLNNWNKDLHVLHCVTGPVVAVFLADYTGKLPQPLPLYPIPYKDLHVLHCVTGPVVAVFLADYSGNLTHSL